MAEKTEQQPFCSRKNVEKRVRKKWISLTSDAFADGMILLFAGAFCTFFVNVATNRFDPIPMDVATIGWAVLWGLGAIRKWDDKSG